MFFYCLYGMKIKSDLEFLQLVKDESGEEKAVDVVIEVGEIPEEVRAIEDKKYEFGNTFSWLSNITTWLLVENGNRITYKLQENGVAAKLGNYILGWGMSMLAMQRGILAMHCSAVADETGAILIAGESGAGKSTLTAGFLENGYRLMADDMSYVKTEPGEKAMAYPAFPFQKLCRDAALAKGYELEKLIYINEQKDKFLVPYEGAFPLEPVPVKGFFYLGVTGGKEVEIQEIEGLGKFPVCANNLFLRHLLKEQKYEPRIGKKCLELAAATPIYAVGRPAEGDTQKEMVENLLEIAASLH